MCQSTLLVVIFLLNCKIQDYLLTITIFISLSRDDIPFSKTTIPDTYTNFRKAVEAKCEIRDAIPIPTTLNKLPPIQGACLGEIPFLEKLSGVASYSVDSRTAVPFKGGESAGLQHLQKYLWDTDSIATYKDTRNGLLGEEYSTKFSIWLANGSLSVSYTHLTLPTKA